MPGRPRKPETMKQLSGTSQPCRQQPETHFNTITKVPPPPKYMNKYAKKLYKTTANQLAALQLLNEVNLPIVVGYANEMGKYWEAEFELQQTGRQHIQRDQDGNVLKIERLPLDKMATEYLGNAKAYANELGITPASASKVKAPETKPSNPFSDF